MLKQHRFEFLFRLQVIRTRFTYRNKQIKDCPGLVLIINPRACARNRGVSVDVDLQTKYNRKQLLATFILACNAVNAFSCYGTGIGLRQRLLMLLKCSMFPRNVFAFLLHSRLFFFVRVCIVNQLNGFKM